MTELVCSSPGLYDSILLTPPKMSLSCPPHLQAQLRVGVREPCPARRIKSSLALAHGIYNAAHLAMPSSLPIPWVCGFPELLSCS